MNHSLIPSSALEAEPAPNRHLGLPSSTRPPEEQEDAILAHQARIDAARNQGLLKDLSDSKDPRHTFMWEPGYEDTARAIQLGQGLGHSRLKKTAVSAPTL